MNVTNEPTVDFQLGALGVGWDRAQQMKRDLLKQTSAMHCMSAEAKAPIVSDNAAETGKRLCYNGGIDGRDDRCWIEDIPSVHVDWDMTETEWEELRGLLWHARTPYTEALRKAGKLGQTTPPLLPPVTA